MRILCHVLAPLLWLHQLADNSLIIESKKHSLDLASESCKMTSVVPLRNVWFPVNCVYKLSATNISSQISEGIVCMIKSPLKELIVIDRTTDRTYDRRSFDQFPRLAGRVDLVATRGVRLGESILRLPGTSG